LRIDKGAALSGRAELDIHADEVVDGAAAETVSRSTHHGDDSEASNRRTLVISNRQHDVTRAQGRRFCGLRCRQSVRLEPQDGNVRTWIAARERGFDLAPAGKRNLEVLVPLQNFFRSDDNSGTPVDAARRASATAMDSDYAACGVLDQMCGKFRKRDKRIGVFGHSQVLQNSGAWPGYGIAALSLLPARWLGRRW
jgi:hypothetical protein